MSPKRFLFFAHEPGVPPARLDIQVSRPDADTLVVAAIGVSDLATVAGLQRGLHAAAGLGPSTVLVDLDGLTFFDALTLGELVAARRRISLVGGRLTVRCARHRGRRLLEIANLSYLLDADS